MTVSLKYAVVERERRFLVRRVPEGVTAVVDVVDRYVDGTRIRLRQMTHQDGAVVLKLGHKVRLTDGPAEVACTNFYLDEAEHAVLSALPARVLHKRRHVVERDDVRVVVDEHDDGTLVAEIDDADGDAVDVPHWLEVLEDVSDQEGWTGRGLAGRP